jgi:hypothetical protein
MTLLPSLNSLRAVFSGSANRALLVMLALCFVSYSFLIARTVVSINQRKDVATQIQNAQANLAATEIKYFSMASTIDMTKAQSLGFVDSPTPDFAYTNPTGNNAFAIR